MPRIIPRHEGHEEIEAHEDRVSSSRPSITFVSFVLRDRIRPGVRVLFVGINPGIRSATTGHHFAGFSNRFWKLLYESALVPEPIGYQDDGRLPEWGYGITNIVPRRDAGHRHAGERRNTSAGRVRLRRKVLRYARGGRGGRRDRVSGDVSRAAWGSGAGAQPERIGGATVFVLPNPSGRNANYSYKEMLAAYRLAGAPPRHAP